MRNNDFSLKNAPFYIIGQKEDKARSESSQPNIRIGQQFTHIARCAIRNMALSNKAIPLSI